MTRRARGEPGDGQGAQCDPDDFDPGRVVFDDSRKRWKREINNTMNLSRDGKPVLVYVAPRKQFRAVKSFDDLRDLLAQGDSRSVERIVNELSTDVPHRAAG
ncbi:MAG TPA: hypothetical protein VNI78_05650 [Vicinamibacterales bacterium]|nr:hypothetical protein [Vicinamibacterales bacterium]